MQLPSRLEQVINEFKKYLPNFETRIEQLEMMERVYNAMLNDLKSGIHAPTGTGKSLGYIIPFIAVKLEKPQFKIAINTFTIELQKQLRTDIELGSTVYENILRQENKESKPIKFVTMKGKSNYFCEKRFEKAKEDAEITELLITSLDLKLRDLKRLNLDYEIQNIGIPMKDDEWEKLQVEKCENFTCPHKKKCAFFEHYFADEVDLYVTNHSLFFTRHFYVGPWTVDFYAFDEAHKLEKVLLENRTYFLSMSKVEKWVRMGANLLFKYGMEQEEVNAWIQEYLYKHPVINNFRNGLKLISNKIDTMNVDYEEAFVNYKDLEFDQNGVLKLIQQIIQWQENMYKSVNIDVFPPPEEEEKKIDEDKFNEDKEIWQQYLSELNELETLLGKKVEPGILWVEKNEKSDISLKISPPNIKAINSPFNKGLLLTSGTLAQNNTCQEVATRLNIKLDVDMILPTPFNLKEQTIVYISKNINPYDKMNGQRLLEEEIWQLILSGNLKTFILFNSAKSMQIMYKKLEPKIKELSLKLNQPIETWMQQKNNHKDILTSFKSAGNKSILFGLLTYFEGIDLKGDALTQIILTRLPYSVPTHPVQQILDSNRSNFSQWEAIIRMEQAFGRLIRTFDDYGSFSVLDNRILKKPAFLKLFEEEQITITHDITDVDKFHKLKQKGNQL